jgi:hypothetical protein
VGASTHKIGEQILDSGGTSIQYKYVNKHQFLAAKDQAVINSVLYMYRSKLQIPAAAEQSHRNKL